MKSISTLTGLCPNAVVQATKYGNQFIVNGRWVGTYQNWEVTPGDAAGSRKNRKVLRDDEIAAYVNTGALPVGFEARSVISGGMGRDEAKAQIAAKPDVSLAALAAGEATETPTPLLDALCAGAEDGRQARKAKAILRLVSGETLTKEEIADLLLG